MCLENMQLIVNNYIYIALVLKVVVWVTFVFSLQPPKKVGSGTLLTWHGVFCLCIELYNTVLVTLRYSFLEDMLNFLGSHQDRLLQVRAHRNNQTTKLQYEIVNYYYLVFMLMYILLFKPNCMWWLDFSVVWKAFLIFVICTFLLASLSVQIFAQESIITLNVGLSQVAIAPPFYFYFELLTVVCGFNSRENVHFNWLLEENKYKFYLFYCLVLGDCKAGFIRHSIEGGRTDLYFDRALGALQSWMADGSSWYCQQVSCEYSYIIIILQVVHIIILALLLNLK